MTNTIKPKGILKFVTPSTPLHGQTEPDGESQPDTNMADRPVWYYPQQQVNTNQAVKVPYAVQSEFTLFFFSDSTCRNSRRFIKILGQFLKNASEDTSQDTSHDTNNLDGAINRKPCQCIMIPNDDVKEGMGYKNDLFAMLADFTEFWHLGFDHSSRLSIIRLLSISVVPTLVVVDNTSGRLVTRWGMEAIESSARDVQGLLGAWRKGESGVPAYKMLTSTCALS